MVTRGRIVGLVCMLAVVTLLMGLFVNSRIKTTNEVDRQAALQPFYTPPAQIPGPPGTIIRQESLGIDIPGATAIRMMYVTQRSDGTPAVSSGMVFMPTTPAPAGGRPVVAWAHGTVGGGLKCAPSRSVTPTQPLQGWLPQMLSLGWIVTATDYVGLGTPGTEAYLVGQDEARDVVNSVRAARSMTNADASDRWVVWGHSQGGHAAIWTGELAASLAPELHLLGVAAAAPAAQLPEIMQAQWDTPIGWVIGPAVAISWPLVNPDLPMAGIISQTGLDNTSRLQAACVTEAAIEAVVREKAGQQYFDVNPSQNSAWFEVAKAQTPTPLPPSMPIMLAQGTGDNVVLPGPNALLQNLWCAAGSTITTLWMGGVNHMAAANVAGPAVVPWINDRFHDVPASRTCGTAPPVPPTASVSQP